MNRKINKVAVIGSGIMGSGIACHFANIGIEVLLLDIVPNKLSDVEIKKNLRWKYTDYYVLYSHLPEHSLNMINLLEMIKPLEIELLLNH